MSTKPYHIPTAAELSADLRAKVTELEKENQLLGQRERKLVEALEEAHMHLTNVTTELALRHAHLRYPDSLVNADKWLEHYRDNRPALSTQPTPENQPPT